MSLFYKHSRPSRVPGEGYQIVHGLTASTQTLATTVALARERPSVAHKRLLRVIEAAAPREVAVTREQLHTELTH